MILLKLPFHLLSAILSSPFYVGKSIIQHYRMVEDKPLLDLDNTLINKN